MSIEIRLECPICSEMFITKIHNKIYCGDNCRDKHNMIKEKVTLNNYKQTKARDANYKYDIETNKLYLRNWVTIK